MKTSYFVMNSNNKFLSTDGTFSSHHPKDAKALSHETEADAKAKVTALAPAKLNIVKISKPDPQEKK